MRPLRLLPLLGLLAALPFVSGCDSSDGGDSVRGVWELRGADEIYVSVTADNIDVYDYLGDSFDDGPDCYNFFSARITEKDGSTYTLRDTDGDRYEIQMTVSDGDLRIRDEDGDSRFYGRSTRRVNSFTPVCR